MSSIPSEKLGSYQLREKIGEGGMGVVYRAYDPALQRELALKLLPEELVDDSTVVARFIREAQSLAQLQHRNLLQVYSVSKDTGRYFFAMELVEGETLSARLRRESRLSVPETVAIIEQVCLGLREVHRAGLVHRDLKPGNIMIDRTGRVILMDFGLAKRPTDHNLTRTGLILGTPDYMSPEQARAVDIDARSDLYSLGVVLYRMLSGRVPFYAKSSLQIIRMQLKSDPPPIQGIVPELPGAIADLVHRMLAKAPEERPQSVDEVLKALAIIKESATHVESGTVAEDRGELTVQDTAIRIPPGPAAKDSSLSGLTASTRSTSRTLPVTGYFAQLGIFFLAGMLLCLLLVATIWAVAHHFRGQFRKQASVPSNLIENAPEPSEVSKPAENSSRPAPGSSRPLIRIEFTDGRTSVGHLIRIEDQLLTYEETKGEEQISVSLSEIVSFGPAREEKPAGGD